MRGEVAISVTATPAAAPRRSREVLRIIIREPSGLRLRPTTGLDRRVSRLCGTPHIVRVGLHRALWQRPIGLRRPSPQQTTEGLKKAITDLSAQAGDKLKSFIID